MSASNESVERIGLLFVHGIGEQKRFEHLTSSVAELAELLDGADARTRVSIVDRTPGWMLPPGEQDPDGVPPITLSVRSPEMRIDYDCHEVWWADLGSRDGIFDLVSFWLWGLGQWAAPIYREVDASRLDKDDTKSANKAVPSLARLPPGIAGVLSIEPWVRIRLFAAGLTAAFTAVTWSLAKKLAGSLLGQTPSPTLIVQYVGDVRTYTESGKPGAGTTSDPGDPRRVGIRRRMVREMVAVATKPLDGWYVLAHSLGTVAAYNGLTEIGHTLPNYLSEAQWQGLPERLKTDPECRLRRDIEFMMPSRPAWLEDRHCLNRPVLFEKLRGVFTYGSPLAKFAALWPRIVATATDGARNPFPDDCPWINFAAPQDPVAGMLYPFDPKPGDPLYDAIPRIQNIRTPMGVDFGLAHIRYLKSQERFIRGVGANQKWMLARWLLGEPVEFEEAPITTGGKIGLAIGYPLIILALWVLTVLTFAGLRTVGSAVSSRGAASIWAAVKLFFETAGRVAVPVLGTALAIVTLAGLWRWRKESHYNLLLAKEDQKSDPNNLAKYWETVIGMMLRHQMTATAFLLVSAGLTVAALGSDWSYVVNHGRVAPSTLGTLTVIVSSLTAITSSYAQTIINRTVKAAEPTP